VVEQGYFDQTRAISIVDFYFETMEKLLTELRRQLERLSPLPIVLFQTICDFVGTL
jgi:hypothetical protein